MASRPTTLLLAALAGAPAAALAAGGRAITHERSIYLDAADVPLRAPEGVACDERGTVVVADTGNARLVLYTWKDGALDGGTAVKLPQLQHPVRVQIDGKGFVLALDRRTRRVVKVDAQGSPAGFLEPKGAAAPVTVTAFKLDAADNAYLLDGAGGRVVVLAPDGRVSRELPLPKGAAAVTDVAVDAGGKIYVVDAVSATVYAADPGAKAFAPLATAQKEMLGFPGYLAVDHGRLWVVDQNGGALVRLGVDGAFQARELALGWSDGTLRYPAQLCLTSAGDVIVADRANDRVQIFALPR